MPVHTDSYTISARYYDEVYAKKDDLVDLDFYVDFAKNIGGPVLELACGTGRVLLPIARQGIAIHGVDSSPSMLEVLRNKLMREPKDVRELVSVFEGDIRNFRSNTKYPLVIIPFRPLQHMYTVTDQVAALETAAFHLEPEGMLVFDVFYPRFSSIYSGIGEEVLEFEWIPKSDPGKIMRRYFRKDSSDKIRQTFSLTFIYRTYQGGKLLQEETAPLQMSYYTYPHLRALFMLAGLEGVEEYGSFDRMPLDNNSDQMIFVVKRQ
jgi:SAM-dependent methyltransferase